MRRLIFLFIFLGLVTTLAAAQQAREPALVRTEGAIPLPLPDDVAWRDLVQGLYVPVELEPVPSGRYLRAANDVCPASGSNLPAFNVSAAQGGGANAFTTYLASDQTIVNGYTVDDDDPLACSLAPLANGKGYRTAWYRFTAPATGRLTVTTLPNFSNRENYDTIVTLLGGNSCQEAQVLACNDDANGLLSQVEAQVSQGEVYYIEVADYNLGVSGVAKLSLQVRLESADFSQTNPDWNETPAIRSRHATEVIDGLIYVFGGQTIVDDDTPTRTDATHVFNPATGEWSQKASMPGTCAELGYSNVDSVYYVSEDDAGNVQRRVYFPSGYVGDAEIHSAIHCVYDVDADRWSIGTPAPFIGGDAPIYAPVLTFSNGFSIIGGLQDRFFAAEDGNTSDTVYTYFVENDLWLIDNPFPALPGGRYAHTGVTLADRFFCITGGVRSTNGGGNVLLTDSLCLDQSQIGNGWQTIAGLNVPRFNASSALGEDGSWIVYGGVGVRTNDNNQTELYAVPETEVYDFDAGVWIVLDDRFDIDNPARAWSRGGYVDGDLWVIGGEADIRGIGFGSFVTNFVERVRNIPLLNPPSGHDVFLPTTFVNARLSRTLTMQAVALGIGQEAQANFNEREDRFDVYQFMVTEPGQYQLRLTRVPIGDNYDLALYNDAKVRLKLSENVGNSDEVITQQLEAGTYFVIVAVEEDTTATATGNYRFVITR